MPLVISSNFVLTATDARFPVSLDHPVIGWHNVVTAATIVADSEDAGRPASDLANPATHLYWRSANTADQYLTVTTDTVDPIDYFAVAGHNFGSGEIVVSVEGYIGGVWTEIVEEHLLANDGPLLFRFTSQSLSQIRLKMQPGSVAPRAAVCYVGALLTLERRIYVGHTPMPYGRKNNTLSGTSESGNFLGRNVLGSWRESTIPLSLISPDFYREIMDEFMEAAKTTPFFFAWRPESYPLEVGYGWLTEDPMPTPQSGNSLIAFDLKVRGIV